jgi:hypothetical protein
MSLRWSGLATVTGAFPCALRAFWRSLRSRSALRSDQRSSSLRMHRAPIPGTEESSGLKLSHEPEAGSASTPPRSQIDELLRRIQGEFLEMPGLRLTVSQAQRLWGLGPSVCDAVLAALVETKFLTRTRDGAFVRSEFAYFLR